MVKVEVFRNSGMMKKGNPVAVFMIGIVPEEVPEKKIPEKYADNEAYIEQVREERQNKIELAELECKRAAINAVRELCGEVAESGVPALKAQIVEEEESEEK